MIKRSRPVYLADTLVDVEVENTIVLPDERSKRVAHVLTVAGERRPGGRAVLFPRASVQLDQRGTPVSVTLHCRSWLVNDGVVGTLPVFADNQHAARTLADEFVVAAQHDVVDAVAEQVRSWCESYVREHDDVELIVGWSGHVRHVEAMPPTHVDGVLGVVAVDQLPAEIVGQRGPFTPVVDPDSIAAPRAGGFAHTMEVAE